MSLQEAFEEHAEVIKKYFAKYPATLGSEKLYNLNLAYAHAGTFLFIPKGVTVNLPFVTYHWTRANNSAILPHTLIIAEEGAKASLIEVFSSCSTDNPALAVSACTMIAGKNSDINRKTIQNWNRHTISFQCDVAVSDRNSRPKTVAINIGGQKSRYENVLHVEGEGVEAKLISLTVADQEQEFDQRTRQIHHKGQSNSDLLYKNALFGNARTTFAGLIRVDPEAQRTDAYQSNRNLLLSPTAEVNSLPGLEIEANDVKCSHGSTTGQIRDEDLFYMTSRGITKEVAKQLLTFGFFEEILDKVENKQLVESVRALLKQKFFHG